MKNLLLVLLLVPAIAQAQLAPLERQHKIWELFVSSAALWEVLDACERDYTRDLLYRDTLAMAGRLAYTDQEREIVIQMWDQARFVARQQKSNQLAWIATADPELVEQQCNKTESAVISIVIDGETV